MIYIGQWSDDGETWHDAGQAIETERGWIVPNLPTEPRIRLRLVRRHENDNPSLITNSGKPGFDGNSIASQAAILHSATNAR